MANLSFLNGGHKTMQTRGAYYGSVVHRKVTTVL